MVFQNSMLPKYRSVVQHTLNYRVVVKVTSCLFFLLQFWFRCIMTDFRTEYFEGFLKRHPVFPTQYTPLYSNAAYHILGYVLEKIAGDTFETVLHRDVFEPLGMTNSGVRHPEAGTGVVPSGATVWDAYIGDETP